MRAKDNQPDWQTITEKCAIWLPQLASVGEALLEALAVPGRATASSIWPRGGPANRR